MRNNPIFFVAIFSLIILLIDFYAFRGVKKLIVDLSKNLKRLIKILFWIVPAILIAGLFTVPMLRDEVNPAEFLIYFHFISGTFVLFYIPKLIFIIFNFIDDLTHGTLKLFSRVKKKTEDEKVTETKKITRSQFLTRIGIITAGIPFLSIAYGIAWGRFDLTVRRERLFFTNLPKKFDGLRVVQLSDFHIGSLLNHPNFIEEIVNKVNSLNADILLFTGDFVNNVADEMEKFVSVLSEFKAKYGKYSVLGNHDYGEYIPWKSEEAKSKNLEKLKQLQKFSGFNLILNDSRKIKIDDEEIEIIGVENWGLPPFPQYGDLKKAMENVNPNSFKILMSHDPTHWDEQVLGFTDIDLTLSGHTHGAQFGIEIPGWRWSPVNVRYKRWGGLYTEGNQHLYVNTGVGFIGFPGRVGMPPEITVLELSSS
ncbi:MAG: metallophosphoesterase [Ignavibacteriae bacterium]|nr:metallophosphoesterase [Ignavibacteriota bacterium]